MGEPDPLVPFSRPLRQLYIINTKGGKDRIFLINGPTNLPNLQHYFQNLNYSISPNNPPKPLD
jgi:hypothetical protein